MIDLTDIPYLPLQWTRTDNGDRYVATGATHQYRVRRVWHGTGPTNFLWYAECSHDGQEWEPAQKYNQRRRLKDAKADCRFHNHTMRRMAARP